MYRTFFFRKTKKKNVIDSVSITINQGEKVALLGKNGAGKTTIIKLLVGILEPTSGEVTIDEFAPFEKNKAFLKNIGLVLGQKSQLIWDLPPVNTLNMLKVIYGIKNDIYNKRLTLLLEMLGISDLLYTPVRKLSMGERVKFEITCALIHSPKYLFLDEPTIGLDIVSQRNIYKFLNQLNKEENVTIILTSHYMKDIEEVCERVLIMNEKKIKMDMELSKLIDKYSINESIKLVFETAIPHKFKKYKLDENTIEVSDKILNELKSDIDITKLKSMSKDKKGLDDIVYEVFAGFKE